MNSIARIAAFLLVLTAVGCGGNPPAVSTGMVTNGLIVGLTDAPGDFATYQVDVTSLTVTRTDGTVVQVLPQPARVDFAAYANTTEFLTALTLHQGTYKSAMLTLDYSHADIRVYDGAGDAVAVGRIQDGSGGSLSTVTVPVMIGGNTTTFSLAAGAAADLTVDFNLAASHTVDFTAGAAPTLTVQPVITADIVPADPKIHRLRGVITGVGADGFQMDLRPFSQTLAADGASFGTLTVDTTTSADTPSPTVFSIDWRPYQGGAGLAQLAILQDPSPVLVLGSFNPATGHIIAADVLAGAGMAQSSYDSLHGTVTAVQTGTDTTLTLSDAVLTARDASAVPAFIGPATVTVDASTTVGRQFDPTSHSIGDIAVGQRVTVLGTVTNPDPAALTFDAANGWVRMELTTIDGNIVAATPTSPRDPFTVSLQSISGRPASLFQFTGTGIDPAAYTIQPPDSTYRRIPIGAEVWLRGYPAPLAKAPGADDFNAAVVVSVPDQPAWVTADWETASFDALVLGRNIRLSLTGLGNSHDLYQGGMVTDLTQLGSTFTLAPPEHDNGFYIVISARSGSVIYTTFSRLVTVLEKSQQKPKPTGKFMRITARGQYDPLTNTLTADIIQLFTD